MKKKKAKEARKSLLISVENIRQLDQVSGGMSCDPTLKPTKPPCGVSGIG